jgi:hypothetical protein
MTPTIPTLPPPALSPDVRAFAAEKSVTEYLPRVLDLVRQIFPTAPITVLVEDDPEIEDYRHIVLDVDVNGLEVPQQVAAQEQWSAGILRACPATHAVFFLLGMR